MQSMQLCFFYLLNIFTMKKLLFLIALIISASGFAQQGKQGVVKVQGSHPHELLTKKAAQGTLKKAPPAGKKALGDIPPINCWTGHLDPTITLVDTAYLIVKWTDGKRAALGEPDSMLVWGYVWNPISIYIDPTYGPDTTPVTKYSVDMLRAVANADCRFIVLLQQTGVNGYAVGGFGYNYADYDSPRIPVVFDLAGAEGNASILFHYVGSPNCDAGQRAVPYSPQDQASWAVQAATSDAPKVSTGVIEHPFSVNYGYPAYDFDYWKLTPAQDNEDHEWLAGWYTNGYWASYNGEDRQVPAKVSNYGVTTRVLQNNSTDGFAFETDFTTWPPTHDMSGDIFSYGCNNCNLCPIPSVSHKPKK
ncbi:hypothetical protein Barb4_04095 [Bacteroidales bacterium Barb4]|nr:hypothetical protein Barb4_04095 [Bacteroidales bacterium Barb4]